MAIFKVSVITSFLISTHIDSHQTDDRYINRVIYIEDNQITKAFPEFSNEPGKDLYYLEFWDWATKESVKVSGSPQFSV
jgi:hypothetical protein